MISRASHRIPVILLAALALASCRRPDMDSPLRRGLELATSEPERALEELGKSQRTDDHRLAYGVGIANEALGRYEAAQTSLEKAVSQAPRFIPARVALARVRILRGEVARAHAELTAIVTESPGSLTAVLLLAVTAMKPEETHRALVAVREWPSKRPPSEAEKPLPAEYLLALGTLAQREGPTTPSRADLQRGAAAELYSPEGALALARLARALHKPDLSSALVRKMAASRLSPVLAREVVDLALDQGQLPAAKLALAQLATSPEDPATLLLAGRYQAATGERSSGIASLRRSLALLQKSPSSPALRDRVEYELARALLDEGKLAEAEPVASRLVTRDPKLVPAQLLLARIELGSGRSPAAIARLERLRNEAPKNGLVHENLGVAQLGVGHADAAEAEFRALLALEPKNARAAQLLAQALTAQGKHDEAAKVLEVAADRSPGDEALLRALTDHYLARNQPDRAVTSLVRRVEASPGQVEVALHLAATYERLGRKDEMRQTLLKLTERAPRSVLAWTALARLEEVSGDQRAAEEALLRAVGIDPRSSQLRSALARFYVKVQEPAKAEAQYQEILKFAKDDVLALNNAASLCADELGAAERAVSLAERAHALAPKNPAVSDTLGWALVRRGKSEDLPRAVTLLSEANAALKLPATRVHLATALHLSGKQTEAKELTKGLALDVKDPGQRFAREVLARAE